MRTSSTYSQTLHLNILNQADLHKLNGNPKLCVVECAKVYIEIRKELVPPEIKHFLPYGNPTKLHQMTQYLGGLKAPFPALILI